MATVGLQGFYAGKYSESEGSASYTSGKKITKAVSAEVNYTKSEQELYADNALDDKVSVITKVDITVTPNDDLDPEWLEICGVKKESIAVGGAEATETFSLSTNNEGDFIGLGYVVETRQSGKSRYMVEFFPKCKFYSSESESISTKGENIEFNTAGLTGNAYKDVNGKFVYKQLYDTEAEAIAALNKILAIS